MRFLIVGGSQVALIGAIVRDGRVDDFKVVFTLANAADHPIALISLELSVCAKAEFIFRPLHLAFL